MTTLVVERRRSFWDVVLGVLLIIAGVVILGHTVIATVISVFFIGWMMLLSGVIAIVAAFGRIGREGFWAEAITGGLLTALGVMILRNPGAAALTLVLVAGSLLLVGGISRLIGAFQDRELMVPLLLSGLISTALGLVVLFNIVEATFTFLGIILGVETIVDGLMLVVMGRVRVTPLAHEAQVPSAPVGT